jgi:hypothetical protein
MGVFSETFYFQFVAKQFLFLIFLRTFTFTRRCHKNKTHIQDIAKRKYFFAALIIHDENALLLFLRKYFSPKERKKEKVEIDRISHILEKKSVFVA